jgi:hypothetical protein
MQHRTSISRTGTDFVLAEMLPDLLTQMFPRGRCRKENDRAEKQVEREKSTLVSQYWLAHDYAL